MMQYLLQSLQGGNILHGAVVGLVSAAGGELMAAYGGSLKASDQLAVQCVVGGTISELGGGNFANGAVTAAFALMFNHLKHYIRKRTEISYKESKPGVITTGKRGGPGGSYGVNYNVVITEQDNIIKVEVYGNAVYISTPGKTTAAIVASLVLDGVAHEQILQNPQNDVYVPDLSNWNNATIGQTVFNEINSSCFSSISLQVRTYFQVDTITGYAYPKYPLPVLNIARPLDFKYEYKIK